MVFLVTEMSEKGKSLPPSISFHTFPLIDLIFFALPYRITRAFMIEELNSIKQKAASADGAKKKGKKGKKSTKK